MARGWFFYLLLLFGWLSSPSRVDRDHKRLVACFFFTPLHTKKVMISVSGARCGACSARTLRKFALNVRALCMRRFWNGFDGVWLPLSLFLLHTCVFSCLKCGRWRCVFRHAEVSSRGKEHETSSQKVTSARPYAFGWAWGSLERSCAMMRALRDTELRVLVVVFSRTLPRCLLLA